ncbi:hypothetical protein J1614_002120 [Plenodomus biglobosus]|nr:hypothetical protein J1614_002120 [Plenodomus biglobosus]
MSSSRAAPSPHNDYIDMSWLFRPEDDNDIPDNETYFAAPAVPITLTPSAQDILKKLKTRCAWQLQSLRDEWRLDLQALKHETIYEENDKNGVWRYAGMLIAMPEKWSKHLQGIIRNNDAKHVEKELGNIPSQAMVKFVRRLRSKPTAYVDQVSHLWFLMNGKKERGHEAWTRYYTDMGLLLQTPDDQVKEIFRILMDEIKAGRIRKGEHWRMFGYVIPPARVHIEQQGTSSLEDILDIY